MDLIFKTVSLTSSENSLFRQRISSRYLFVYVNSGVTVRQRQVSLVFLQFLSLIFLTPFHESRLPILTVVSRAHLRPRTPIPRQESDTVSTRLECSVQERVHEDHDSFNRSVHVIRIQRLETFGLEFRTEPVGYLLPETFEGMGVPRSQGKSTF